jgi:hypothetical protein
MIILVSRIYIFSILEFKHIKTYDTIYNPEGLGCLNYFGNLNVIIYPIEEAGNVFIDIH